GLSRLSWVVTAYLLASTVSTPLWGKLGDQYGRKIFFQAAIVIFLIGSALAGLSQTMTELIIFRAVQGIGGGGLLVGAQTIVGRHRAATRPRPISGLFRRGLRREQRYWTADRRLLRGRTVMAVGVLRQPAARRDRADRRGGGASFP